MQLWVGTSGYVYPEWVGDFYPRGTSSARMLSYYAGHFPIVELNFSYYQLPTSEQFAKMLTRVPPAFQFIVKAHQSLTHDLTDEHLDEFRASLGPMHQSGQLRNVLFQFPQRFHRTASNERWIDQLLQRLEGDPIAVEFRHASWDRANVDAWLRDRKATLVSVDVPDIAALYPRKLVRTTEQIYVRLHSRRASAWYASGAERYDYVYSDAELREWIGALQAEASEATEALVLFNNCNRTNAVTDARRMLHLLSEMEHPFQIIPPAQSIVRQGVLFE